LETLGSEHQVQTANDLHSVTRPAWSLDHRAAGFLPFELMAKIVNGADTDNTLWNQPEAAGLNAIAEGFRHIGPKNDHEMLAAESICMMPSTLTARRWSVGVTRTVISGEPILARLREMRWHAHSVASSLCGLFVRLVPPVL
jgi:hypothetical protein